MDTVFATCELYLTTWVTYRKRIETAGSNIEKKLPASIHAVTAEGFELKVFLFVLALSFDGLI